MHQAEVESALTRQAAVALLGPRQAGKTTLALMVAETRPSIYLDLESPQDRAKLAEPALYFAQHPVNMSPLDALEVGAGAVTQERLWLRGGFPDSFLAASDEDSFRLRQSFIRTYLERDVQQFGLRVPAETLNRLWTMLAHNQAATLNASRLAAALDMSSPTIARYLDLLADLLLVRRLPPFHANAANASSNLQRSVCATVASSTLCSACEPSITCWAIL